MAASPPCAPRAHSLNHRCGCLAAWLPVLIAKKSPRRDPRDPPCHSWRGLVHTNYTRCAESRSGCIQRIPCPPSNCLQVTQKSAMRHAAPAAVPAANLGPGTRPEPAPTNHGGYGRNPTGGWLADDPRAGCRTAHARAGWWCWVWCAGGVVGRDDRLTAFSPPKVLYRKFRYV
jgi:hypothetical protein